MILVQLAQDGSHAGHVVTLGEKDWSGTAEAPWPAPRAVLRPQGARVPTRVPPPGPYPGTPAALGDPHPPAATVPSSPALQTSPPALLNLGFCSQPFLSWSLASHSRGGTALTPAMTPGRTQM